MLPILGAAVGLAVCEVALRLGARATHQVRGAVYDARLGWRLLPKITKVDPQWSASLPATTNSDGWRDAEFAAEPTPGKTRVVALGDSFTFGYGVDYGDRFTEVLEARRDVDVLNLGVFAYGTDQELLAYVHHGRPLDPDLVLLTAYLGNDLDDIRSSTVHSFPKPYFEPRGDSLALISPVASPWLMLRSHSYLAELLTRVIRGAELRTERAVKLEDDDEVKLFVSLIRRLHAEVTSDGAQLLTVLVHPAIATSSERVRHERAAAALFRAGVEVVDVGAPFEAAAAEATGLYLPDGHWSPSGHRLYAQIVEQEVVRRGWLPAES